MKRGTDISATFNNLYVVHQNIPNKKTKPHSFPEQILFIPLSGRFTIKVGLAEVSCGVGHMVYLPANLKHEFISSEIDGERIIAMWRSTRDLKINAPLKLPLSQLIKEIVFYLLVHPKTKSATSLTQVFNDTLAEVVELNGAAENTQHLMGNVRDRRLKDALKIIESSSSEPLRVREIAKASGLSERNFNRLLVQETGFTPKQWQVFLRIEQAKELLQSGMTVTETAQSVGYESLSQFISAFRSRTGQLPSKFVQNG